MVFSRFFKPREGAQPAAESGAERDATDEAADDSDGTDDDDSGVAPEAEGEPEAGWGTRAAALIPGGASTGSKRPAALFGDAATDGPTHFARAAGCRLITTDGDTLIDCTMALGAVAIGYAEPQLTRVVLDTAASGHVAGLSHVLEVEVAERFCGMVPCAERVRFLKTGAEAVAAAVRLARTYTARDVVIGSGYFGWLDWCSRGPGIPEGVSRDYREVPFDDIAALEQAVAAAEGRLAAIVLEPVVERLPSPEWIARARQLCDAAGAVLIFDEIKTGFRLATGGYQQFADVTPDLATFGKALANGYALSAVCGRADVMDCADRTWISSTLASEGTALAAAGAVLRWHEASDVCADLAAIGKSMRDSVHAALSASGLAGVTMEGLDPMWFFRFESPDVETRFLLAAARQGVLFKRGAYNFPALAHDEEALSEIETAASNAFVEVRDELAGEA